jgi:hypothetical protein
MKKALIVNSMLALALVVCGSASAALHTPVAAGACGTSLPTTFNYCELPTFPMGGTTTGTEPIDTWPVVYDFCGMLDGTACSVNAISSMVSLGDMADLIPLLQCINADINGPVDTGAAIPVTGNGIPDGQFELGVVGEALSNSANPYNAEALAAFKTNFKIMKDTIAAALIGEGYWGLTSMIPALTGSLGGVLSGYVMLGDPTTDLAIEQIFILLQGIGVTPPAAGSLVQVPELGPLGDADGDGANNRAEYMYYKANGAAAVIAATFDAAQTPPVQTAKVIVLGGGIKQADTDLELTANALNCTPLTFQWSKDTTPIASASGSSFSIQGLQASDSGSYVCTITIDAKATVEINSAPVVVDVVPVGSVPIAGGLGLALLAGACALGGVGSIRRRK